MGDLAGARQAWDSGLAAAQRKGDKQAEKEMTVFLRKLDKTEKGTTPDKNDASS